MKFKLSKILKDKAEVKNAILNKRFITYATSYSFKIADEFECDYNFVADGWPVALYSSILSKKKIHRLSFFKLRDFWISEAKQKKIGIIGYEEKDVTDLKRELSSLKIVPQFISDGFKNDDDLCSLIESQSKNVEIIFLGISQPRQEQIMKRLDYLEGTVSIISCGAFWIQEILHKENVTSLATALLLVPLTRFWKNPKTMFARTFYALPKLVKNLKNK